ncbi:hypothetical protein PT974_04583 [Cladobotryum mycophilum]|uniref:GPI anchored protein n=1 Tax=Cladobotryum mycophilum TaxID=491253 RepID=A0ABR0SWJ3_9HYPO
MFRVLVFAGLALANLAEGIDDNRLPKSLSYSEEYCYETIATDDGGVDHPKSRLCYRNPDVYESSNSFIDQPTTAVVQTTTLIRSRSTIVATVIIEISTLKTTAGATSDAAPAVSSPCSDKTQQPAEYEHRCSTKTTTTTTALEAGTAAPVISSYLSSRSESHAGTATSTSDDGPPVVTGGAAAVNAVRFAAVGAMAGLLLALV